MNQDQVIRYYIEKRGLSDEEALAKMDEAVEFVSMAKDLLKNNDAVVQNHMREITCYGCDLIRYLDCDFDPFVMSMLFMFIVGRSTEHDAVWSAYMENNSDEVNGSIIEKENPEGRLDS